MVAVGDYPALVGRCLLTLAGGAWRVPLSPATPELAYKGGNMAVLHSYPWYFQDWRSSRTRAKMTLEEQGLFRNILDILYEDGSIPDDPGQVQSLIGAKDKEFNRAWPRVRAALIEVPGGLTHPRVQVELPGLIRLAALRSGKARLGADARWNRKSEQALRNSDAPSIAPSMPVAMLGQCLTDAQPMLGSCSSVTVTVPVTVPVTVASLSTSAPDLSDIARRIHDRHPKHRKGTLQVTERTLAALVGEAVDPARDAATVDANHAGCCASEEWTREGGRYVPFLDRWLSQRAFVAPPPAPGGDPHRELVRAAVAKLQGGS